MKATIEAGINLDVSVAEEVFGYEIMARSKSHATFKQKYPGGDWAETILPKYSQDIGAAFLVVNHLCRDGRKPKELYCKITYAWQEDYGAWVYFDWKGTSDTHPLYRAHADTVPLAICLAALKAVRDDVSL